MNRHQHQTEALHTPSITLYMVPPATPPVFLINQENCLSICANMSFLQSYIFIKLLLMFLKFQCYVILIHKQTYQKKWVKTAPFTKSLSKTQACMSNSWNAHPQMPCCFKHVQAVQMIQSGLTLTSPKFSGIFCIFWKVPTFLH